MRKTYIAPECEVYNLPSTTLMTTTSPKEVVVSGEEADQGGFSKQWGGGIFEDDKPFE